MPSHFAWCGASARNGAAFLAVVVIVGLTGFAGASAADSVPFRPEQETPAQGTISVEVVPSVVAVGVDQETTVRVAVSNTGAAPGSIRSLDLLAPAGVEVSAVDQGPFQVGPGARVVRSFDVTAPAGTASGKLVAVADVSGSVAPPGTVERFTSATAELNVAEPVEHVKVSIVSAPADLSDGQRNRKLTVLVQNPTAHPLRDIELQGIDSSDITVGPAEGTTSCADPVEHSIGCIDELGRGESIIVTVDLSVDSAIATGTQSVGVVAVGQFAVPGAAQPTSASATTTIDLAVFGVTVLSPFGASAVFFLPAIVAFVTFVFAGRVVYPRTGWLPPKADASDPTKLTLLLPAAGLVYVGAYALFGIDLTEEMKTAWVAWLFIVGFAAGAVVWLIYIWRYWNRIGRKLFKADDSPEKALERLASNEARLARPQLDAGGVPTVILGKGAGDTIATSALIVPSYTGDGDPSADLMALVQTGDPSHVLANMSDQVTLHWAGAGIVLVPAAEPPKTRTAPIVLIREQ